MQSNCQRCLSVVGLALGSILALACLAECTPTSSQTAPACAPRCRIRVDGTRQEPVQCRESEDCGERPHTQRMMCMEGGLCQTACAEHWADCNKDYRDGCESATDDDQCGRGEPARTDPLASVTCMRESLLSEPYDCNLFEDAADGASEALSACYRRVLSSQPRAEDAFTFAVTVGRDGRVERVALLQSDAANDALQACAFQALSSVHVRGRAEVIAATYPCRAVFTPGSE